MTTTYTHTSGVADSPRNAEPGRGWLLAGLGAGVAGIVTIVGSSMAGAVYDESVQGDPEGIVDKMADQVPQILLMHTGAMVSALLLLVFAAGLRRHLASFTPQGSLLPDVAAAGLILVSVALLLGSALTTEFVFGLSDPDVLVPETAVFFGHWIGTVPWCYVLAGLSALAVWSAARLGTVPRWMGRTSLVLGGLTLLVGIAPVQYMASLTVQVWLLAIAIGFVVGDRAHRSA